MKQPSSALVGTETDDDVLTAVEAAKMLGVSTSFLRRLTRNKQIAFIEYSKRIKRYRRRELLRFQEAHTCASNRGEKEEN